MLKVGNGRLITGVVLVQHGTVIDTKPYLKIQKYSDIFASWKRIENIFIRYLLTSRFSV